MSKSIRKASIVTASSKGSRLASALTLAFYVAEGTRPTSGDSLRGFTVAWMDLARLHDGASLPRPMMQAFAGKSMVSNHLSLGNIEIRENGEVGLTAKGRDFFANRTASSDGILACAKGWRAILSTGKADGALVRNASHLLPISNLSK